MAIITPINLAKLNKDIAEAQKHNYIMRVLIVFDMLCNAIFLNGMVGETISSHAGRAATEGRKWGVVLCWVLGKVDPNHDVNAEAGDIGTAEAVIAKEEASGMLPDVIKITE